MMVTGADLTDSPAEFSEVISKGVLARRQPGDHTARAGDPAGLHAVDVPMPLGMTVHVRDWLGMELAPSERGSGGTGQANGAGANRAQ